ncbi:MAG: hypothetical protein R3230_01020 [Nitrosopumilaceae archaeon]|nr:hypothetical protein [Nitrosopumilaceae archaeon]
MINPVQNDEFGTLALKTSIENLFHDNFFDICTLDNIISMMRVNAELHMRFMKPH